MPGMMVAFLPMQADVGMEFTDAFFLNCLPHAFCVIR
jgi:hypothetical protein